MEHIRNILNFINEVMKQKNKNVGQLFTFLRQFKEIGDNVKAKLPWHINVIDELHANENAHSRILAKLLQQETPENNRFEILESFVQYLKKKSDSFGHITVETPDITKETERIDLWIRDKTYAIVIENKIHWAPDQAAQIERYIDATKRYVPEEQIYVVYLPSTYEKEPERQSWGKYFAGEIYTKRYLQLSFREDILTWLKEDVLPNVRIKDVFLKSTIEQYIDHLEGLFDLRITNKTINMELQNFIKKELELNGTPQENITKLMAKQEELNSVNNQLQLLKENAEKEIFREWQVFLSKNYSDYEPVAEENYRAGLLVPIDGTTIRVSVSFDSQLYCQIDSDHLDKSEHILPEIVKTKTAHLLTRRQNSNGQIWKYFPRYAYDEVYNCLTTTIEILRKL